LAVKTPPHPGYPNPSYSSFEPIDRLGRGFQWGKEERKNLMSLFVVTYTPIDENGQEVAVQPIAVRLTRADAWACCQERAEQMADNLDGQVIPGKETCAIKVPVDEHGHALGHVFAIFEVEDVPERFHSARKG
jgi:hypothetical protein